MAGRVFYEVRGGHIYGDDRFYDILNVRTGNEKVGANLPVPKVDRLFMRMLAERVKIQAFVPDYVHDRKSRGDKKDKAGLACETVLEMSEKINLRFLVESVYTKGEETRGMMLLLDEIDKVKRGDISRESFVEEMKNWRGE